MVLYRATHDNWITQIIYRALWPCMKTSICCYGGKQVKSNQHLDICLVSTQERKRAGVGSGTISMQQTVCCISAILMWWSRPEHRQTALGSSPPLCTVPRPAAYHGGWGATDVRASCTLRLLFPRQRRPLVQRAAASSDAVERRV